MDNLILTTLTRDELQVLLIDTVNACLHNYSARPDAPAPQKILSLAEFCDYAGLTKQTAYKLTSAQKVPHSKRGKRLYFDREKVDAWLLENQVATQTEINQKSKDYLLKSQNRRRM
jgi:excisionase family DNA binding protein